MEQELHNIYNLLLSVLIGWCVGCFIIMVWLSWRDIISAIYNIVMMPKNMIVEKKESVPQ